MDSLDQFLLQTKIDLESHRAELTGKDHLQPYRHVFFIEYLMPVGMRIPSRFDELSLRHFFIQESSDINVYISATVIHGHPSDKSCSAPKMCHLYGFWPTAEYHAKFRKVFEARWKPYYLNQNWEIPK